MKHEMKLNNGPFIKIKDGTKTVELRLNDEKRRLLNVGDVICFTNNSTLEKLEVLVENLHPYDSFEELYKHFDKVSMGYNETDVADYRDMLEYYSSDEQSKYGVLGIKIKKL